MKMSVATEKLFLYQFLPVVLTIGSINFVIVFYLVTSYSLYLFIYFYVCNSYNRSLLKMYVVTYETSSNTENFY